MQVVFYGQSGNADIWYVLQPYYSGTANCPSSAWQAVLGNCYLEETNYQVNIGAQPVSNLQNLSLSAVTGSTNITMTISAGGSTVKSIGVPNLIGVSNGWTDAEFNIFGDGGGDSANFAGTPTIQVQTEVQSANGSPSCVSTGNTNSETVETNNLNLVANCCVASANAITFLESGVSGASCTLCGAEGQTCCSVASGCASASDACYSNTCRQLNTLTASPSSLSVQAGDGISGVNQAVTNLTPSGYWATVEPGVSPSLTIGNLPAGVSWAITNDIDPPTVKFTAGVDTVPGTYTIQITGTLGEFSATTNLTLTVGACQPTTCAESGWVCGSFDDGCGGTSSCGTCPSGESCTGGACYTCAARSCPPPEFWNPTTCRCQGCPCGYIHVNGHYICAVCKP
jgi:hypothetical protein